MTARRAYNSSMKSAVQQPEGELRSPHAANRRRAKKESRAKALPECAHIVPVDSDFSFLWSGCDFSRRRFSSHRLGPQPRERNIIARTRSIRRISYSYLISVQFVTMVVVHCTITWQYLSTRCFSVDFAWEGARFADCRACNSRSDPVSLPRCRSPSPNHARSPCDFPVSFFRSCAKPRRKRRTYRIA